jgi:hypothetical protein
MVAWDVIFSCDHLFFLFFGKFDIIIVPETVMAE